MMVPDWILALQSCAALARRLETNVDFEWDDIAADEMAISVYHIETLLNLEERRHERMANTQ